MISSTSSNEHAPLSAWRPAAAPAPVDRASEERGSFLLQLTVLPEMLATLETATTAGQLHIMGKILGFIEDHVSRACEGLSARNQRTFSELLGHLRRESQRLLPDVRSFVRRAESLMSLVAASA